MLPPWAGTVAPPDEQYDPNHRTPVPTVRFNGVNTSRHAQNAAKPAPYNADQPTGCPPFTAGAKAVPKAISPASNARANSRLIGEASTATGLPARESLHEAEKWPEQEAARDEPKNVVQREKLTLHFHRPFRVLPS